MKTKKSKEYAREIGYALVNRAQDKRRLYRVANLLVNLLAERDPETVIEMLGSQYDMLLSSTRIQREKRGSTKS